MNNYKKVPLTIDIVKANIYGLIMFIPLILIYGIPFFLLWNEGFTKENIAAFLDGLTLQALTKVPMLILIFLAGVVLHELIHGIIWAIYAKNGFRSVTFGVMWKMLTPYCHCKEPLKVKHYIFGAVMPSIILGLLPALYAILTGNVPVLLFGMFFTMAAIGDFMVIYLLRNENMESLVEDHPSEAGCFVYRK